jgi:hypothetical protein
MQKHHSKKAQDCHVLLAVGIAYTKLERKMGLEKQLLGQ